MTAKDLKNALLQEAVQGKLVPQIASEVNALDLLEEIRKKRGGKSPSPRSYGEKLGDKKRCQINIHTNWTLSNTFAMQNLQKKIRLMHGQQP